MPDDVAAALVAALEPAAVGVAAAAAALNLLVSGGSVDGVLRAADVAAALAGCVPLAVAGKLCEVDSSPLVKGRVEAAGGLGAGASEMSSAD